MARDSLARTNSARKSGTQSARVARQSILSTIILPAVCDQTHVYLPGPVGLRSCSKSRHWRSNGGSSTISSKNDLLNWLLSCAAYAAVALVQGTTKLVVNVYRGWVGENAVWDLRRHVLAYLRVAQVATSGRGPAVSGPRCSLGKSNQSAALSAAAYPSLFFRAGYWPQSSPTSFTSTNGWQRQLGVSTVDTRAGSVERDTTDGKRIDRVLQLNMGIYKLKFSMNFFMNLCNHHQIIAALLIGGWMVHSNQLEVGGIVAFISGVARLNDPWFDPVNYFRDLCITQVKDRIPIGGLSNG